MNRYRKNLAEFVASLMMETRFNWSQLVLEIQPTKSLTIHMILVAVCFTVASGHLNAQNKKVVVTETLTAPTGNNYHALQNMTLESGFIYDAGTSGTFYAQTGDFVNPEPSYGNDRNSITTEIAKEATTSSTTLSNWGTDNKSTVHRYADGLGRTVQSIYQQGSPLGKDIIRHLEYDPQGRNAKAYLPYVGAGTGGAFHSQAAREQGEFYDNNTDDIADSDTPFSETEFDNSPLGRVLKMGSPGDAWQLNSGHTPEFEFRTSDNNTIRQFESDGTSPGFWGQDALTVNKTTDENGNRVEQYSDKFGRQVLKKIEQSSGVWSFTFHIYDDMGRLIYTIQPEGYQKMVTDNNFNVSHVLNDYVFIYTYDGRGRLVEKKVPGSDPMYYIYDQPDRIVLMQDGNLRVANKWNYTKYDEKHRTVVTGFHVDVTNTTRSAKQAEADAFNYGTVNHFEEPNMASSTHYYTNRAYPTSGNTPNLVYYYDHYDIDQTGVELDYQYTSQGFGNQPDYNALNRVTAIKQRILGESTWLLNVTFYDHKGRPIQTKSNNQRQSSLNDLSTSHYAFDGRITDTKRYVDAGL